MKKSDSIKLSIAENNQQKRDRLIKLVSGTSWKLLKKGSAFAPGNVTDFVIIGVAVWDNSSMGALDKLASKHPNGTFFVFDIDDCSNSKEMEKFAAGVRGVSQIPVVAEYQVGKLNKMLQGKAALEWLMR